MSDFQRRFVIGSISYTCLYVPAFVLVWHHSKSLPEGQGDGWFYILAPFHVLAVVCGIAGQVLAIRGILRESFPSRWTRDAWLAFVVFAPQLGPLVYVCWDGGPRGPTGSGSSQSIR